MGYIMRDNFLDLTPTHKQINMAHNTELAKLRVETHHILHLIFAQFCVMFNVMMFMCHFRHSVQLKLCLNLSLLDFDLKFYTNQFKETQLLYNRSQIFQSMAEAILIIVK